MNNEYHYLGILAFWVLIWTFAPIIALPLFIIYSVRNFRAVREHRQNQEYAKRIDRERWAKMEGLTEDEYEPADWWKK